MWNFNAHRTCCRPMEPIPERTYGSTRINTNEIAMNLILLSLALGASTPVQLPAAGDPPLPGHAALNPTGPEPAPVPFRPVIGPSARQSLGFPSNPIPRQPIASPYGMIRYDMPAPPPIANHAIGACDRLAGDR